MKPEIIDGLNFVNASYHSVHGLIKSEWVKEENTFSWNILIPGNTKALVYVPANSKSDVTVFSENTSMPDETKFLRMEKGRAVFEAGSGEYHFKSKLHN